MLRGTLGSSLLWNILEAKEINRDGEGAIAKSVAKERKLERQVRGIARVVMKTKKF